MLTNLPSMVSWSLLLTLTILINSPSNLVSGQRFDLDSLRQAAVIQGSDRFACDEKDTHFELVTGYVYTAPDDMLDSRPGTLMLTDCIELCRRNSTCKSANFETGLCVLFGSSAEEFPGGLTASQFPVFTLYIQKVCLDSGKPCDRAWTFEKVSGFAMDKYAKKRGRVNSREQCEVLCLTETEFPCRSAAYNTVTGDCRISDMDRHTIAGTGQFVASPDDEFMENNCVDDPVRLCDFQLLENRIMKTVDSVYQDVPTMEACRDLCLTAPYRCHSFDYGDTGERVCRLSHHTSTTLTQIQEPFLVIEDVVGTYELSSCYNVTIDCRAADMIATVRTNKIFNGKIYAKDNPNSCVVDVENAIEFDIKMGYNDIECNVKRKSQGVYTNEVIIQHHDSIVTALDLGLALNCQYDLSNRTILNDFDLAIEGEIEPSMVEEAVVDSPNVIMKVTERGGADVDSAQVGDPLELHFEIFDQESPYEIFVRDLVAKDGNDQAEIVLIDSRGCPAEGQIMGPLNKDPSTGKILISNFDAFKFPTSEVVQFRAHVTPCMPTCEPVECTNENYYGEPTSVSSYGRKKRALATVQRQDKTLVTNSFVVMDKFQQKKKEAGPQPQYESPTAPVQPMKPLPTYERSQPDQSSPPLSSLPWSIPDTETSPEFMNFNLDYDNRGSRQREQLLESNLKTEKETAEKDELCINATGIIVAIVTFLVLQIIIAIVWTQFWQKKKKKNLEEQNYAKQMFNPYAINTSSRH